MANIDGQNWCFAGHLVTGGVRAIYYLLAEFLKRSGINFANFPHHHMSAGTAQELQLSNPSSFLVTGCTDGRQSLIFLLRKGNYTDYVDFDSVTPVLETLTIRGLNDGKYLADVWEGWNNDVLGYDTAVTPADLPPLDPDTFRVGDRRQLTVTGGSLVLRLTMKKGLFLTIWLE